MALIECADLSLGYEGRTVAEGINFSVCEGDYLCIVGENGSGKSTLMKTLLGIEKPISGRVIFGDRLKKNEIGYLPQRAAQDFDFPASVYEVVMSGCINKGGFFRSAAKRAIVEKNLEKMGISDITGRCYRELSGGQIRRVLLARALCAADRVVLLDEPVAGLDPVATAEMYETVRTLSKEGITVIMVTHDAFPVLNEADRVLHLAGTQLFFGSKEDYLMSDVGKLFASQMGGR